MTVCENLFYTPWHALPEHKPLGAVNHARRVVYTDVSKLGHGLKAHLVRTPPATRDSDGIPGTKAKVKKGATQMKQTFPQVYLVRHGETAWSISGQHTGRTDIALTERGEHAAQELRARLKGLSFVKVFTSPLQRARQTAELADFGESAVVDPDLMEWDYGDYEGRRTVDIRSERPGWRLFEDGCPGGETLLEVATRAERVIGRIRALESNVLVFAHRDILRILTARWIALPALEARRLDLATASVSTLGYDHGLDEPVIRLLNDARHA